MWLVDTVSDSMDREYLIFPSLQKFLLDSAVSESGVCATMWLQSSLNPFKYAESNMVW